jgi:hypothetical protein
VKTILNKQVWKGILYWLVQKRSLRQKEVHDTFDPSFQSVAWSV